MSRYNLYNLLYSERIAMHLLQLSPRKLWIEVRKAEKAREKVIGQSRREVRPAYIRTQEMAEIERKGPTYVPKNLLEGESASFQGEMEGKKSLKVKLRARTVGTGGKERG